MPEALAHPNIALVKYWGKSDPEKNLPAAESLSLTLASLFTRTSVELRDQPTDSLSIDGREATEKVRARVCRFLDLVAGPSRTRAAMHSTTNFRMSSGLASSASAFAALAVAACAAYGKSLSLRELSILARRGSGSAARSIFGEFVRVRIEQTDQGTEAFAEPITGATIELHAAIALVGASEKEIGSTEGMEHTRATSPYHEAWLRLVARDLARTEVALRQADFATLSEIIEGNALAMHADAMAARPGIIYFEPATLLLIRRIRELRASGLDAAFTIDAGPNVVALARPDQVASVANALAEVPGVVRVLTSGPGKGARLVG